MYRLYSLPLAILLFLFFAGHASASSHCEFRLGFKTLRDLIGHHIVGECLENEHYNHIGDSNQHTTSGLMAWRKADNWTAFTDGHRTWINGPYGLVMRLNTERFTWEADYAEIVLGVQVTPTPRPQPTATPAPTTSGRASLTLATGGLGDTLGNPASIEHIVLSSTGIGTWVAAIYPDAARVVLAHNRFNDEPGAGNRFYLLLLAVGNYSDEDQIVSDSDFKLVGNRRVAYDFTDGCGVIPEALSTELYPDGIGGGTVCFEVPQDEHGFVLIYEPLWSFDKSERRYIKLPDHCPNRAVTNGIETCLPNYVKQGLTE